MFHRGFETIPSLNKTREELYMEKAVIVFSGGQDSTTCLLWAMEKFEEVEAVTFLYGQRNASELDSAKAIAEDLGVKHTVLEMDLLTQLTDKDRKSTRLNSSHVSISYAVFCLKKKIKK